MENHDSNETAIATYAEEIAYIVEGEEFPDLKDRSDEIVYSTCLEDDKIVNVYGADVWEFLENGGHPVFKIEVNHRGRTLHVALFCTQQDAKSSLISPDDLKRNRTYAKFDCDIPYKIFDEIDKMGAEFAEKYRAPLELRQKVRDAVLKAVAESRSTR